MTTSNIDRIFEKAERLEKDIKKKFPRQKGRVILANIETELEYEVGDRPRELNGEFLKWYTHYIQRMESALKG